MNKSKIAAIVFLPFSFVYSVIMKIRNFMYDKKLFAVSRSNVPVISIGNITTGGTGKSPLTIWIARYVMEKSKRVAVVSRGYKRQSDKAVIVCDGKRIIADVAESGDELMMISEELLSEFRDCFVVAAGSDRVKTIEEVLSFFDADVIVLDDAFQHRKIFRDLDIVLVNAEEYYTNQYSHKFTLPSGNLRESKKGLKRADIIIQNNKAGNMPVIPFIQNSRIENIAMRYKSEYFVDAENVILHELKENVILFCGLADNESFHLSLLNMCVNVTDRIFFADHHNYTESDVLKITRNYTGKEMFVTTQKDFTKIRGLKDFIDKYNVCYLKINLQFEDDLKLLTQKIDKVIGK